MEKVNKLNVNTKRKKVEKFKVIIGGVVLAGILTGILGVNALENKQDENQKNTIIEYFGQDSEEKKILDYIDISERLNKIDFEGYVLDENLFEKYNISNELKSPSEIIQLISKFDNIEPRVSSKDIVKQTENIETVLNLIRQESLVNSYIYASGYSLAHENVTKATKEYAGEVFGLNDENIKFKIHGSEVTIENNESTNYGYEVTQKYGMGKSMFLSKEEDNIYDGINHMNNVDVRNDKNHNDDDQYNSKRNEYIKDALEYSVGLYEDVRNEDLYDDELASHFRK